MLYFVKQYTCIYLINFIRDHFRIWFFIGTVRDTQFDLTFDIWFEFDSNLQIQISFFLIWFEFDLIWFENSLIWLVNSTNIRYLIRTLFEFDLNLIRFDKFKLASYLIWFEFEEPYLHLTQDQDYLSIIIHPLDNLFARTLVWNRMLRMATI